MVSVAMWIGKATEAANHWPAPESGDPLAKARYVRDSEATAVKRRPAAGALAAAVPLPLPPVASAPLPMVAVVQPTAAPPCRAMASAGRKAGVDWATAYQARAAKRSRAASSAEADGQALRLQDWVEARPALAPPPTSAEQRMRAIRERLATKRRSCGCAVLGPLCGCDSGHSRRA